MNGGLVVKDYSKLIAGIEELSVLSVVLIVDGGSVVGKMDKIPVNIYWYQINNLLIGTDVPIKIEEGLLVTHVQQSADNC